MAKCVVQAPPPVNAARDARFLDLLGTNANATLAYILDAPKHFRYTSAKLVRVTMIAHREAFQIPNAILRLSSADALTAQAALEVLLATQESAAPRLLQ